MSATAVPFQTDIWTVPEQDGTHAAAALAATRATTFMRAQALWLRRGLECAGDPLALEVVMAAHDRSHDRWVRVISHVGDHLGEEAAQAVSAVYGTFGKTAGCLERDALDLVHADVAERVRAVLARRLEDMTEQVIKLLWRLADERTAQDRSTAS
jgi:hypothetical protein